MKQTPLSRKTPLKRTGLERKSRPVSRRAKACDIPQRVKAAVWERDGGRCVLTGETFTAAPNAHFISRAKGGLGIEKNIFTATIEAHRRFDSGGREEREAMREQVKEYLQSKYEDWDESKLVYRK